MELARALYRDSDIFIIDDITSALDSETTLFIIKETIGRVLKGKTVIMTTNNLSFLKYADHIVYIQDGKILSEGKLSTIENTELWKKHLQHDQTSNKKLLEIEDKKKEPETADILPNLSLNKQ